jgi:protein-disulfide isomerase
MKKNMEPINKDSLLNNPKIIIFLGILLLVMTFFSGTLWTKVNYLEKNQQKTAEGADAEIIDEGIDADKPVDIDKISDKDHVYGDRNSRIILFEYSDFECPFCKKFHLTAKEVADEYKGKVAWVYRHFPLDQLHPKARKQAEASECAAEIGGNDGFWKFSDKIYEITPSNNGLDMDKLPEYAMQVGLDKNKFKECLDSGKYAQRVEADYQSGIKAGVRGTPGTILLDTKTGKTKVLPGAVPKEMITQPIEELLKN